MDAAKLECEHPGTLLHPACLFPWIQGVFDTMAIVGNGCGKIRGGWEQPILAICLQYAGKRGRRSMFSDHQWHTANSVYHFNTKIRNLGYSLTIQNFLWFWNCGQNLKDFGGHSPSEYPSFQSLPSILSSENHPPLPSTHPSDQPSTLHFWNIFLYLNLKSFTQQFFQTWMYCMGMMVLDLLYNRAFCSILHL